MTFQAKNIVLNTFFPSGRPTYNSGALYSWLARVQWTPEKIAEWQQFYNDAARFVVGTVPNNVIYVNLPTLPAYNDLMPDPCTRNIPNSSATCEFHSLISLFISLFITIKCSSL